MIEVHNNCSQLVSYLQFHPHLPLTPYRNPSFQPPTLLIITHISLISWAELSQNHQPPHNWIPDPWVQTFWARLPNTGLYLPCPLKPARTRGQERQIPMQMLLYDLVTETFSFEANIPYKQNERTRLYNYRVPPAYFIILILTVILPTTLVLLAMLIFPVSTQKNKGRVKARDSTGVICSQVGP